MTRRKQDLLSLSLDFDNQMAPLVPEIKDNIRQNIELVYKEEAVWYLAQCMAIDPELIYDALDALANHSEETPAYIKFYKTKKSGGKREIRAPIDDLKKLLKRVYHDILAPFPLNRHVHGFRPRRTIVTNASVHLQPQANFGVNYDIKDFFPSTPINRIRTAFEDTIGLTLRRELVAAYIVDDLIEILAKLSTLRYGRASTEVLPVGAPTSPCLANHVLNGFDIRLAKYLKKLGNKDSTIFTYSRYGDDLSVFSPNKLPNAVFGIIPSLLDRWGYEVQTSKTRIMERSKSGPPLEVTGLIISEGRVLISDHTLSKWSLALLDILLRPKITKGQKKYLLGILGMTKMVYGASLAPRIAGVINRVKRIAGESQVEAHCSYTDDDSRIIKDDEEKEEIIQTPYDELLNLSEDLVLELTPEEMYLGLEEENDPFRWSEIWHSGK